MGVCAGAHRLEINKPGSGPSYHNFGVERKLQLGVSSRYLVCPRQQLWIDKTITLVVKGAKRTRSTLMLQLY